MSYIDIGIRCDRHTGEVFPPRCGACQTLTAEWELLRPARFIPGTVCPLHPDYPQQCERCRRDRYQQLLEAPA